jgi:hypothetical protein
MSIAVICCKVLEREVRSVLNGVPDVVHLEIMEWGLHTRPDVLRDEVAERVRAVSSRVDAVLLGYGRCQAMDRLPADLGVPVFFPPAEDCIGVLLGQDRYAQELQREAGTWFMTPGWADMGIDFIFHELQMARFAAKGIDPLQVARRMLANYTRALFIDMGLGDRASLLEKARAVADAFDLRLEITTGNLALLRETWQLAQVSAKMACRGVDRSGRIGSGHGRRR